MSFLQRASSIGTRPKASGSGSSATTDEERYAEMLKHFREEVKKGTPLIDVGALSGIIDAIGHTNAIDDRKMLLEHVLTYISRLNPGPHQTSLQNATIELLYLDLPHPASSYVGPDYAFRSADGSGNNLSDPNMGKAGTPYARSVQQSAALPQGSLPDPGLIFDTLLKRDEFVPHPAGLSSMMFSFAALVIHTVFRTSHDDVSINETSSYIDLAPLYGVNQDAQNKVRLFGGRGLLRPDTFAEDRLLLLPPAVCALLVLFNRNHNYIAKRLFELNERGTFVDPDSIPSSDPTRSKTITAQDDEIFQTARLVNCTWFGSCVFSDYFSAILGLVRQGNTWSLNPFGEIRKQDHSLFERGRGNVCSVEFNCLYRWHATTSQHDEKWVEGLTAFLFPNKAVDDLTLQDLLKKFKELQAEELDCYHWTFGQMQRQDDGTFKDEELAAIIHAAISHPAGAFRARGTPHIMRLHEIMGIEANRRWGVCSLNDFRKFLGLKPYTTFLEWNSDPDVARSAEKLYGHIDRLELYTGLQAEEAKPVMPGAGLCPSYTISRAILSDAIALTRGDRFFTADYTPYNMTAWGFADCQRDAGAPGYGSTLGRLFMRALPGQFKADSTYTWFPLMTPDAMKIVLENQGDTALYDLAVPTDKPAVDDTPFIGYSDVAQVLGSGNFASPGNRVDKVVKGNGFFIASTDLPRAQKEQKAMLNALVGAPGSLAQLLGFFYDKTRALMLSQSWTTVGGSVKMVDIVRDVLKFVPIYWASEVAGIKLKVGDSQDGLYTPSELFQIVGEIYEFCFLDFEHYRYIPLSQKVKKSVEELTSHIKAAYGRGSTSLIADVINSVSRLIHGGGVGSSSVVSEELAKRFGALGYDADTLANSILAVLVGASVELSQALVNVVNTALDQNSAVHVSVLNQQQGKLNSEGQKQIEAFVLEALRLDPAFTGSFRTALAPEQVGEQAVVAGQEVFVNIATASLDSKVFPNPKSIDTSRKPRERYLLGDGVQQCLGRDLAVKVIAEVLRGVYSYNGVQRGPEQSGKLNRFKSSIQKTSAYLYLDETQKPSPWATSMVVQFN